MPSDQVIARVPSSATLYWPAAYGRPVDSPPTLPVTDASLLASIVDGVVICLRAGVVERQAAVACRDRLTTPNTRLLGVLINGVRQDAMETGYSAYRISPRTPARGSAGSAA